MAAVESSTQRTENHTPHLTSPKPPKPLAKKTMKFAQCLAKPMEKAVPSASTTQAQSRPKPGISKVTDDVGPSAKRYRSSREAQESLGLLHPPPAILSPPQSVLPQLAAQPSVGSAAARAEAAALAEKLVLSMRVGRVGKDGHEVRLRLAHPESPIDVHLRHENGQVSAVFRAEGASRREAHQIAEALKETLSEKGIRCDRIEVT